MDEFEKIEKLRQRANVTYEEAAKALRECNGDLLDAMIYLEKLGKVKEPSQSAYSTSYDAQTEYVSVSDTVNNNSGDDRDFWKKFKHLCAIIWKKLSENFLCIKHNDNLVFKVPAWILVISLLIAWPFVLTCMIVSLFFDCRYSFCGKDKMETANNVMDKAGEFAEQVKDEFNKL